MNKVNKLAEIVKRTFDELDLINSGEEEDFLDYAYERERVLYGFISLNFKINNGEDFSEVVDSVSRKLENENDYLRAGQFLREMGHYEEAINCFKKEKNKVGLSKLQIRLTKKEIEYNGGNYFEPVKLEYDEF